MKNDKLPAWLAAVINDPAKMAELQKAIVPELSNSVLPTAPEFAMTVLADSGIATARGEKLVAFQTLGTKKYPPSFGIGYVYQSKEDNLWRTTTKTSRVPVGSKEVFLNWVRTAL